MLNRSLQLKGLTQLTCVFLLSLLVPGCRPLDWLSGGSEADYGRYGLYRVLAFDQCLAKFDGNKKPQREWRWGGGTAFLINNRNLVATNRHVVEVCQNHQAPYIFIVSFKDDSKDDGKKDDGKLVRVEVKKIVSGNSNKVWQEDLALLQPRNALSGDPWPIATYEPSTGSQVRALGFPGAADLSMETRINNKALEAVKQQPVKNKEEAEELFVNAWIDDYRDEMKNHRDEFRPSFTEGIVSRALTIDDVPVVQHQAPVSHGNSGGPLLDRCGNVIGMNTYGVDGSALATSLAGKWIAEQISAAGFDVNQKNGICLAARVENRMTPITIALAILLSSAVVFFAFRKPPWGQPGYKVLKPAAPGTGLDAANAGAGLPPLSDETAPAGQAGVPGYIRLIPVSEGSPLTLPAGRVSYIGRDPGADGVIANSSVSRRHARINLDSAGHVVIEDAGSANGTWKSGAKITRETFASGELVRFGTVEYRIELPNDDAGGQRATELLPGTRGELPLMLSGADGDGQAIQLSIKPSPVERTWTIGRKAGDVDLVIPNLRVSSIHARIRYRPGRGFEICDLGSSNGTKIDGRFVDRDYISLEGVRKITLGDLDLNVNRSWT